MRSPVPVLRRTDASYYARKQLSEGRDELIIALNISL